jgi:integrase
MKGGSDEELLAAIAAGPGTFPEFHRRHVARVTGMGVRRFDSPEDVANFVANVFLEVISERLGHASVAFTLQTYGHVIPGMDRDAAATVADLILGMQKGPEPWSRTLR